MRFTVLATVAACRSFALRQQVGRASAIAKVANLVTKITTGAADSLVALQTATGLVNDICAETGNATDHLSTGDEDLLRSVLELVETTIYSSMDQSQQTDEVELGQGVGAAANCNNDIALRQSQEGDLGILKQGVQGQQDELNRLDGVVTDKTLANNSEWTKLDDHMQQIPTSPACLDYPATPNMVELDVYFGNKDYENWFTAQQSAFQIVRGAFTAADGALTEAIRAYNLHLAVRDTAYCDWKSDLEAACGIFDTCFSEASDFYSNTLVPRVTSDMNDRIQVKNAGDTLTHQIQFLLADVADQQTPQIDTSRYEITFPDLPAKGLCDLSPLGDAAWVPTPSCNAAGPGKP